MEWIRPIDKLPESEEIVLVTVKEGTHYNGSYLCRDQVHEAYFVNDPSVAGTWYPFFELMEDLERTPLTEEIAAWMPLPAPYNDEQ